MAKVQQKSKPWFENLNKARGYRSNTPNWPLYIAGLSFLAAVVIIIIKL